MSLSSIGQYIVYVFAKIFILSFKLIPFPILYFKSKVLKFILQHLVGYRKKVIRENLQSSFPDKSAEELKQIENDTYANLSMIMLESLKGFSMTKKQFSARYKLLDSGGIEEYFKKGKNVVILAGHIANWEWWHGIFTLPMFTYKSIGLYKPLSNKYLDNYLKKDRAKYNAELLSIYSTYRFFKNLDNQPYIYLLLADQSPSNIRRSYVTDFFHKKTYFLQGTEKYPHFLDAAVFFGSIERVKKGHYASRFQLIADNAKDLPEGEIVNRYAKLLEENIKEKPGNWLWSHRRWKHKVPENQNS